MQLSKYISEIEKSEIIIGIFFGCFISSLLFHKFNSNSIVSVMFGIFAAYGIIEYRRYKKIVPTDLIASKIKDLEEAINNDKNFIRKIDFLSKQPILAELLHDCIKFGKKNELAFTEAIILSDTFSSKINDCYSKKNNVNENIQNLNDAFLIYPQILNSIHSLVHNNEDSHAIENNLYEIKKCLKKIMSRVKKNLKLSDSFVRGHYDINSDIIYEYF